MKVRGWRPIALTRWGRANDPRTAAAAVTDAPHERAGGLAEVLATWALLAFFAGAVCWTYARLPAREFFHVSTSGPSGGAGRALVLLNFPIALVALAITLIAVDRLEGRLATAVAAVAVACCAAVFWPGVVNQRDLDARWVNAIAAAGVALALALTLAAARHGVSAVRRARGDRWRLLLGLAVVLLGLEYVPGEFGVFVDRVPVLGSIFEGRVRWAGFGQANLRPGVHLGHHHGFDGALLALAALTLSRVLGTLRRPRVQACLALYLSVMLAYGLANEVQDVWGEQLVKRGVTDWEIPGLLQPEPTPPFAAVVAAGILLFALVGRRLLTPSRAGRPVPLLVFAVPVLAAAAFAALGATADGETVRTRPPDAGVRAQLRREGQIVLPTVDEGWDLAVLGGDGKRLQSLTRDDERDLAPRWSAAHRVAYQRRRADNTDVYVAGRRLTVAEAADGEPAWSPDGHSLAFVSTRDGNRELYVMRADGSAQHRLTRDGGEDEWPRWGPDGTIVFDSDRAGDFDLYSIRPDGSGLRRLTSMDGDERSPEWSPDGSLLAFTSDRAGTADVYVTRRDGTGLRPVTSDRADDFAPAWSPSGRFLLFGSDRDGRDQLFVVRADGSGLARLTETEADKDAPDWR